MTLHVYTYYSVTRTTVEKYFNRVSAGRFAVSNKDVFGNMYHDRRAQQTRLGARHDLLSLVSREQSYYCDFQEARGLSCATDTPVQPPAGCPPAPSGHAPPSSFPPLRCRSPNEKEKDPFLRSPSRCTASREAECKTGYGPRGAHQVSLAFPTTRATGCATPVSTHAAAPGGGLQC